MNNENNGTQRLRVLHCGDIHLDHLFADLPDGKADERKQSLRSAFLSLTQYVREREIDIVLISGDLFDAAFATNATVETIIREFENCRNAIFVIAPGKHDPYEGNPLYASGRLPANCHVFSSEQLDLLDLPELNVTVWGFGNVNGRIEENPLLDRKVKEVSRINLVCGYADIDAPLEDSDCPLSLAELSSFGADYYALGSRHTSDGFISLGDSIYSYCGALESISFEEPGIGGANLVVFTTRNDELSIEVKQVTFGHMRFATEAIDVTGVDQTNEIVSRISRVISEKRYGADTALRVELTGKVDPFFDVRQNLVGEDLGLYDFTVIDKTIPLWHTEAFERDMTIKGEIFRQLLPMLKSEDEDERLTAARAFRVGLAALENRSIDL